MSMLRAQMTLWKQVCRRASQRAGEFGVSLAQDVRRLVARDLARTPGNVSCVFDLGRSEGCDIANRKNWMIGAAFVSMMK
jgi:hypothetical protein